uniref:Palmitoyltransferase n=1 Tax=Scleropages formosus TaxID=113540 RepID=A0A8C9U7G3_SCLFO
MAPSGSGAVRSGCRRVFYWSPVLFISAIVVWSYYAFVLQLCVESIDSVAQKVAYLLVYHVLLFMFVWAYWRTIFTRPMMPLEEFHLPPADRQLLEREDRAESVQEVLRRVAKELPVYTRTASGAIRFCDRCHLVKPDRCHHCSVCNKCILKMDHHCPWVNNCVGFSNYKFFLLFLAYSLLYCLFITATDMPYFIRFWTVSVSLTRRKCENMQNSLPDTQAKFHIMFLFFAAAMFFISLSSLFSYHCWLVCKNRSTLEAFRAPVFQHGPNKNGFSLGASKNIRQVFGDEKKYWALPVFSSLGDGCSFPTCLVSQDPEQAPVPAGQRPPVVGPGGAHPFPPRPARGSQTWLLGGGSSETESDGGKQRDSRGKRGTLET